jgi:hypothetical protein
MRGMDYRDERQGYGNSMRRRDRDEMRDKDEWQLGIWVRCWDMDDRQGERKKGQE